MTRAPFARTKLLRSVMVCEDDEIRGRLHDSGIEVFLQSDSLLAVAEYQISSSSSSSRRELCQKKIKGSQRLRNVYGNKNSSENGTNRGATAEENQSMVQVEADVGQLSAGIVDRPEVERYTQCFSYAGQDTDVAHVGED